MATLGGLALTLGDWAKRVDPEGKVDVIINILSQTNEILTGALFIEGNLPTGHQTTYRTGLPKGTWRQINQGVAPSKSSTAQGTDSFGDLEAYSDIDIALAKLNGNTPEFRLSEDMAFMEGMNQQVAGALIYSNALNTSQQIMGLAPRYSTVNTAIVNTANNVVDCGGTGSTNTSMWIVVWGPNAICGLIPKGEVAGLQHRDLGERTLMQVVGNGQSQLQVYTTHFKWMLGLCVRDWRYGVRICNIDVTQLGGSNAPNLINALIKGLNKLPTAPAGVNAVQKTDAANNNTVMGRTEIYFNRTVRTYLEIQAVNKPNVLLNIQEFDGMVVTRFRGVKCATVDQILNTEARVA